MNFEDYFSYHPTMTEHRRQAHQAINEAAKQFYLVVKANVEDAECHRMAYFAIQQARMFANQGATIDELTLMGKEATIKE